MTDGAYNKLGSSFERIEKLVRKSGQEEWPIQLPVGAALCSIWQRWQLSTEVAVSLLQICSVGFLQGIFGH